MGSGKSEVGIGKYDKCDSSYPVFNGYIIDIKFYLENKTLLIYLYGKLLKVPFNEPSKKFK